MSKLLEQIAKGINETLDEVDALRYEVMRLRDVEEKYLALLHSSVDHNANMLGGLLQLGLKMAQDKDGGLHEQPA